jgi:hypothetical protein
MINAGGLTILPCMTQCNKRGGARRRLVRNRSGRGVKVTRAEIRDIIKHPSGEKQDKIERGRMFQQ